MLDSKTTKQIIDFVYLKPRSVHEISHHIGKNWRTADSYVNRIISEQGIIGTRTFREGTRGALKIVFWNNIERIHSSDFQERLYKKIESARSKYDFSPFDIYQYVDESKRYAFLEEQAEERITAKQDLKSVLRSADKQVLIFSGNLSWADTVQGKNKLLDTIEELAIRNVSIKILCRVDLESFDNIKKMMQLNHKLKKGMIEIRHAEQPLRAFIVDSKFVRFKEIKKVYTEKKKNDLKTYIFYDIMDTDWIEWLQKVFWNIFRTSISSEQRLKDIESIDKIR